MCQLFLFGSLLRFRVFLSFVTAVLGGVTRFWGTWQASVFVVSCRGARFFWVSPFVGAVFFLLRSACGVGLGGWWWGAGGSESG